VRGTRRSADLGVHDSPFGRLFCQTSRSTSSRMSCRAPEARCTCKTAVWADSGKAGLTLAKDEHEAIWPRMIELLIPVFFSW
jgi:hypothetical protein